MGLATQMMKEVADLIRLGFPESTATKIASGELPMDTASRMQRAKEQGYDVDTPVYHGTDADFDEFDPERAVGSQFWSTTNKAAVESREVGAAGHGVIKELLHRINNPADWDDYDNLLLDEIIGRGYDGLKLPDPDGNSVMVAFEPEQYKSVDAAFDPDYKGANLLGEYALPAGSTALMASLLAAPEEAEAGFVTRGGRELLEAWHGSPHQFDKFSLDHLGTGEGAQAYGHGLYFADVEDVATGYRDSLTSLRSEDWSLGDDRVPGWVVEAVDNGGADVVLSDFNRRAADAEKLLAEGTHQPWVREQQKAEAERMIAIVNRLASGEKATPPGALYRTEIDVTPDQLLDWDRPYKDHPQAVRDAFDRLMADKPADGIVKNMDGSIDPDASGMLMYSILSDGARMGDLQKNQAAASNILSESGIKGIKYLDGNSRNRPMRDVKAQFLNELPEDAEIDDVIELLDGDTFSPENKTLLQSLAADDWLGFDYPSQSLSAVLGDNLSNYDVSPELKEVIRAIRDKPENTSNYVIFDDKLINIAERGAATPGGLAAAGSTALIASLLAEDSKAGPLAKVISKTINRQDDANLPWSSEAQYTHDQSGGFMRLGVYPDGRVSTLELEVPEEFRRRGIGGELQESALRDYPEMQGQVSSKSALRNAYRLGRRPVEEPNATLERALEMQSQASSVNMKRPTNGERGAATPGMMALLAAGGAGATAAGSESNAVTEATSRIVNHMLDNVTEVTDLLEIPQRGIQGLLRAGYGLMQGDGLDASLNAGADVVNQGVEETAKQAGDAMLEKTGNPELAAMAYTAVMLGSPL